MAAGLLDDLRPVIRGLESVRVTKEALLKALQENRAEHEKIFSEAIEAWHKRAQERLATMVEQAKRGPDHVEFSLGLPRPDNHTKDYDRVIRMVEMSEDDEFELDAGEFATYVMDEWGWQRAFLTASGQFSRAAATKNTAMGYNS